MLKILALSLAALAMANTAAPDAGKTAAEWAAHPPDADAVFAFKRNNGDETLKGVRYELEGLARKQAGLPLTGVNSSCTYPQWYDNMMPYVALALDIPDEAQWKTTRAEIISVATARNDIHKKALAGQDAGKIYGTVTLRSKDLLDITDPFARDLAMRLIQDQLVRNDFTVLQQQMSWAQGMSDPAKKYFSNVLLTAMCKIDHDNTEWLKSRVASDGWPRISVVGVNAANDAWLLVQHADRDHDFQTKVLALMEALLPAKEVTPQNYAYLYDRVAMGDKRPQRYGTQGRCTGPGVWEPLPVENPEKLDELRAAIGLSPEAEYAKHFTFCTAPTPVPVK